MTDISKLKLMHHRHDFKENTVAGYPLILCPECGSELTYCRYVGFMNGDAYHEYDCTNPKCNFTGRIFKENIYEESKND